jgi:hypothetical protein
MQELNPALDLRIVNDRHGVSYLRHALSSRHVFHLFLPYCAPDYLTTAFTQKNETRRKIHLDGEWTNIDPTRIERSVDGHLFIRPCSSGVRIARFNLGKALITHFGERIPDEAFPGWCLLPENDGAEYFEFDWCYWPEGIEATAARRPDGIYRKNREYWSVLPGGFFGIRDQYDISRDAFATRCHKAVDMGVAFCVMIDQNDRDLTVFRADGREHVVMEAIEEWSLREIPDLRWKASWLGN